MNTLPSQLMEVSDKLRVLILSMPTIHTADGRRALIIAAGLPDELASRLNYDGTPGDFAAHLAIESIAFAVENRSQVAALTRLLRQLESRLGVEHTESSSRILSAVIQYHDSGRPRTIDEFLRLLGLHSYTDAVSPYQLIETIFTPPKQFPDMLAILEQEHCLFILGDPHIGKTFSAVRILWKLFAENGFVPGWLTGQALRNELESRNRDFDNQIRKLIPDHHAVYLEDPFGRTRPIDMPEFVSRLREFTVRVRGRPVRAVITSRSAIFAETVGNRFSDLTVRLSQNLEIGTSYSEDDLGTLVSRYATSYGTMWEDELTKDHARQIGASLLAPHNIELFVSAVRETPKLTVAMGQVDTYRDVVREMASEMSRLSRDAKCALLVGLFFSARLGARRMPELFETCISKGVFGRNIPTSWDRASHALDRYLVVKKDWEDRKYHTARHPSVEEAAEACALIDGEFAEICRRLVVACSDSAEEDQLVCAFECFLSFASALPSIFDEMLEKNIASISNRVRQAAFRAVLETTTSLPSALLMTMWRRAQDHWSHRAQLKFLLQLPEEIQSQTNAVEQLVSSWDAWVRFHLARNIYVVCVNADKARSVLHDLTQDNDHVVSSEATRALATM